MPRVFKVIEGGPDGGHTTATYIGASANDEGGAGGDGGDGVTSIFKLDVRRDVQWMKALWALIIPALGGFLFYFIGEMKDVRKDISGVDSKVAGQSATLSDIQRSLDRIEMRLDTRPVNQSSASAARPTTGAAQNS